MRNLNLALLLILLPLPLFAQGATNPSALLNKAAERPRAENLQSATAVNDDLAEKAEAIDDRLVALEAKVDVQQEAYGRFEVIAGILGVLITLIVLVLGLFARRDAVEVARRDLKKQKEAIDNEVTKERERLIEIVRDANDAFTVHQRDLDRQKAEIETLLSSARSAAKEAEAERDKALDINEKLRAILANSQNQTLDAPAPELDEQQRKIVKEADKATFGKPEVEWTASELKLRMMVDALSGRKWQAVIDRAERLSSLSTATESDIAFALFQKAYAINQMGQSEEALAAYEEVIARFGDNDAPDIQQVVVESMFNVGVTLDSLDRNESSLEAYDALIARYQASESNAVREMVIKAMVNKGSPLIKMERKEDALVNFDTAIDYCNDCESVIEQQQAAMAMTNKGTLFMELDRKVDALATYDAVLARFAASDIPAVQEQVARALFNKACAHALSGGVRDCITALELWGERIGRIQCDTIQNDSDFDSVRARPSFRRFLTKHGCEC